MRLAHISDLHALDLTGVPWTRFVNKRLTGMANLVGRRRGAHPLEILDALVDALIAEAPDHVLITGDVSNLALATEFEAARSRLARLGGYDKVSIIPGNHDVYTRGSAKKRRFESFFGPLMWPEGAPETYPWTKTLGSEVAIVGFSSVGPRLPFIATGDVTRVQLERFQAEADRGLFRDRFTVAMLHHNLHPRTWRKNLMHGFKARDAFLETVAAGGVNLVVHGHTHVANAFKAHGMDVIGCGSSTWHSDVPGHRARFNTYQISDNRLAAVEVRVWDPDAKAFRLQSVSTTT